MNRFVRIGAVSVVIGVLGVLLLLGLRAVLSSGLQERLRGSDPFAVRISIDHAEKLALIAQMVIFPDKNQVFLVFLNTDARLPGDETPVEARSAAAADDFDDYTGVSSRYWISISRENAVRLIDAAGGLPHFLEAPVFLRDGRFQYPQGLELFPGERVLEFALARLVTKEQDAVYTSIDRIYRSESMVMNILWRLKRLRRAFESTEMANFAFSLIKTNLEQVEAAALVNFLEQDAFVTVMEVPIESGPKRDRKNPDFVVKPDSARKLFGELKDRLAGGTLRSESYPVELLNGTERKGLARRVKRLLQDQGPLVLTLGNYDYKPIGQSIILDRVGNTFGAASFARKTGLKRVRVFFARKASQVSLSLILGKDFVVKQIEL